MAEKPDDTWIENTFERITIGGANPPHFAQPVT